MDVVDDVVDNFWVTGARARRWLVNPILLKGSFSFPPIVVIVVDVVIVVIGVRPVKSSTKNEDKMKRQRKSKRKKRKRKRKMSWKRRGWLTNHHGYDTNNLQTDEKNADELFFYSYLSFANHWSDLNNIDLTNEDVLPNDKDLWKKIFSFSSILFRTKRKCPPLNIDHIFIELSIDEIRRCLLKIKCRKRFNNNIF